MTKNKKGISFFHLELSAFQYTAEYKRFLELQPDTYVIWEDYAFYCYGSDGLYKPVQFHVTPTSIKIFKENRRHGTDYIYHWDSVMREYNGERFCENHQEFVLLHHIGEWFRESLTAIISKKVEYAFMSEVDFIKKLGVSFNEHLSFQQKLKLFKRDVTRYYGYPTQLDLNDYFTHDFWYTGVCGKLSILIGAKTLHLQFLLQQKKVNIYCDSAVVIDEHPLLLQVVKMLMKERAYGQVAQVLLQEDARKLQGGGN